MKKVAIPKKIIQESPWEILVYAMVKELATKQMLEYNPVYFDTRMLCYYANISASRRKHEVQNAIESLYKKKIFKGEVISKTEFLVYQESFEVKNEKFVLIYLKDIFTLIKKQKEYVIPFFCVLCDSINNKTHIGYTSEETFAERLDVSNVTIGQYMEILENLKIIYSIHNYMSSSTYGLYEDAKNVCVYNKQRGAKVRNLNANFRRKVSQTYNLYVKALASGKEWDFEKVAKLYQDVLLYNENVEKPKDMSVFPVDLLKLQAYN